MMKVFVRLLLLLGVISAAGAARTYEELEARVVEHELDNGMRFLIFERHEAPLVSMVTAVRAGAVNEVTNKTGLAHFLEHLAFKGTKTIGTTNYRKERNALRELDAAFESYRQALKTGADSTRVAELYAEFKRRQKAASAYVVQGEFSTIYERNGGTGLNASTGYDFTMYRVTLPSNRFELWCAVESDRMANPVFRELYKERNVILEERRMRTDNSPAGLLWEEFRRISYKAHPYGRPIIGHMSDMQNLNRRDVREFYETYYVPQHISIAIVGDVKASEIIPLIDAYFSRIPAKPSPPELITAEPRRPGIRRVEMRMGKSPRMMMGFLTVPTGDEDEVALDLLASVLGSGRTSRLHRALVEKRRLAAGVSCWHEASLYAGSFTITATPVEGVSAAELEQAVLEELAALKDNPLTQTELDAARARWKVDTYDAFSANLWLAYRLSAADQTEAGWRRIFRDMERAEEVTPQDVMDVAKRYLDLKTRAVALMEVEDD